MPPSKKGEGGKAVRISAKRAVAANESDEGAAKKLKGQLVCRACHKRPGNGLEWADHEHGKPCGDKCAPCLASWSGHFAHLGWSQYCDFVATKETSFFFFFPLGRDP